MKIYVLMVNDFPQGASTSHEKAREMAFAARKESIELAISYGRMKRGEDLDKYETAMRTDRFIRLCAFEDGEPTFGYSSESF
jgi:deoxyribose-phosphate aldolase